MVIFLAALFTVYCSIRVVYVFLQWTCIRNGYLQYLVGVKHVSIFSDEPATLSLAQFGLAAVTFPESWLAGWTPDRADRTLTARLISLACGGRGGNGPVHVPIHAQSTQTGTSTQACTSQSATGQAGPRTLTASGLDTCRPGCE